MVWDFIGVYVCLFDRYFFVQIVGSGNIFVCEEEQVASAVSPDKKWIVIVYVRGCGATTRDVMHVNINALGDQPIKYEGIIILNQMAQFDDVNKASVAWINTNTVVLTGQGLPVKEFKYFWNGPDVNFKVSAQ